MATLETTETGARLLLGDPVLVDDAAREHLGCATPAAAAQVDVVVLRQPQDSLLRVRDALQQVGLFAAERAVWIRGLRNEPEDDVDDLLDFLEQGLPPRCRLVATTPAIDQRSRLFKWFKKRDSVIDCRLERDKNGRYLESAIAAFARARMRANGVTSPHQGAVGAIVERAGTDVGILAQEIDKLCLAVPAGPEAADVRAHMRDMGEVWVFALTDALSGRQLGQAEALLDSLLRQGEHPLRLIASLATHVSLLQDARRELDRLPRGAFRLGAASLDKRTYSLLSETFRGKHRSLWRAFHLLRGAAHFREAELADLHARLLSADVGLKSGRTDAQDPLTGFLVHACSARRGNAAIP
ncbi:MAG TPA: DNA polymerase III subunit delta [Gammaproteobacteria bacterium]